MSVPLFVYAVIAKRFLVPYPSLSLFLSRSLLALPLSLFASYKKVILCNLLSNILQCVSVWLCMCVFAMSRPDVATFADGG